MKQSPAIRVLASVLLLGQLQQVPAVVACTLQDRQPAGECDEMPMPASGPVVTFPSSADQAACDLLSACGVPTTAVAATAPVSALVGDVTQLAVLGPFDPYAGFDAPPIPPPPQA